MYAVGITSSDGRCEFALNQWLPRWQLPLVLVCAVLHNSFIFQILFLIVFSCLQLRLQAFMFFKLSFVLFVSNATW